MNVHLASKDMSPHILLQIHKDKTLKISCPSLEMHNRDCPKYEITEQYLAFYFLSQKFEMVGNFAQSNVFKVTNLIYGYTEYVMFERVDERDFHQLNERINRIKLLQDHKYKYQTRKIEFSYQLDDPLGALIKSKVHMSDWLDSSTSLSKMKSILAWVNQTVKHKSYVVLPKKRDVLSLLDFAIANQNKLNCRGLAILTSELCMAAGLYARFVVCSPIEKDPYNTHVMVIAYSRELSKWILLDPTFCLMLFDNNEVPLSFCEFRDFISNDYDHKMVVNPEANYYGNKLDFQKYRKSMEAKLYRIGSLVNIRIGGDESYNDNSIELVPDICNCPNPSASISDPNVFWKIPNI